MKLLSAELTNFCQFRYRQVTFAPGLTAIIGRNGSGKSNLVKAVYAAITGDFGRNDGLKADNISQYAEHNAPSKIHVTLEHCDSRLDITRSLRPAATRLKITAGTNELVVTKTQEATEAVSSILGVSSRMLADYVFVDQWSIFDFLSMMPAERAKAFQRLFRTEQAEVLWKLLGEHRDSLVIPTPGINKDEITRLLMETKAQYEDYCSRLAEANIKESTYDANALRCRIADYQRKQALEGETYTLTEKIETYNRDIQALRRQIDQLSPDDIALAEYVTAERDAYHNARQLLGNWSTYEAVERNRQQLTEQLAAEHRELQTFTNPPPKPTDYVGLEDDQYWQQWYVTYNDAYQEVQRLRKLVDAIKRGSSVCETCGTPLIDANKRLGEYELKLNLADRYLQEMEAMRAKSRVYDRAIQKHQDQHKSVARRYTDIEAQLHNLASVPKPDKSQQALQHLVKTYEAMAQAQQDVREQLTQLRRLQQGKISVHEQLCQDETAKEALLVQLNVSQADAVAACAALAAYEEVRVDRLSLDAIVTAHQKSICNQELQLAQLDQVERKANAIRAWADHVDDMRHILHRDNLPRLVAHNFLELMQDEINSLLVRFGSTFSVCADESLSFMASFHDGRKVPAGRLSGGEKVLLALAFRVVVNDIFAKDLGLLVLDEPTAGLDEGNLACLRIAVTRLKELSAARGLQVIIITHERDLHNLFDHVIEMGKD
jgi:DNA repair exonuclease SbcCD ATPase subunit